MTIPLYQEAVLSLPDKQAIQERYSNSYDYDVGLYHLDIVKVTFLQRDADGVRTPQKSFA